VKKKRFFFHYRRQTKSITVHWQGKCHAVADVICKAPCETKWNTRMPMLVIQGWANTVEILDGVATIA